MPAPQAPGPDNEVIVVHSLLNGVLVVVVCDDPKLCRVPPPCSIQVLTLLMHRPRGFRHAPPFTFCEPLTGSRKVGLNILGVYVIKMILKVYQTYITTSHMVYILEPHSTLIYAVGHERARNLVAQRS